MVGHSAGLPLDPMPSHCRETIEEHAVGLTSVLLDADRVRTKWWESRVRAGPGNFSSAPSRGPNQGLGIWHELPDCPSRWILLCEAAFIRITELFRNLSEFPQLWPVRNPSLGVLWRKYK